MIENFKAHRADFIEAVRRYREYPHRRTTLISSTVIMERYFYGNVYLPEWGDE
ncbi:hypothetical protein [Desulfomicrobium orale]|uniref:hypothetical protein n=1 Tax=Desulfomicrobium orale TaxID=132132 RepID=UPI0012B5EFA1|nr:hypothetical protein [Desulfomicrobium orale]